MLTYFHDNVGNFQFIWPVGDDSIEQSQSTIKKVKQEIPVYHTQAMH